MGKPSLSRVNSKASLNSKQSKKSLHVTMSAHKKNKKNHKKMKKKFNKSIGKLFDKLCDKPEHSDSSGIDVTDGSVICLEETLTENRKRKNDSSDEIPKKRRTSCIVIEDDDLITCNEPCTMTTPLKTKSKILCSTPISNGFRNSQTDLNISNVNRSEVTGVTDLTEDNFVTIDLTTESVTKQSTVIDLVNTTDGDADCSLVNASNPSLSISGESDVTVLNRFKSPNGRNNRKMNNIVKGISKLNESEKGRLLKLITQNIFNGCNVSGQSSAVSIKQKANRGTITAEDEYIREVILGETQSRNSIGSNIYNPQKDAKNKTGLRMIVIDGSNVAMEHTKGQQFSVKGLKICIDYFLKRGHTVKAFVPRFRCKFGKSTNPRLLDDLERQGLVVYTPSREVQGKFIMSYDDRYIVQCAAEFDGVIVSGDNFRDLMCENPRWRFIIENRLLPFTWVNDMIMFPKDPLGRRGITLDQLLRHDGTSK